MPCTILLLLKLPGLRNTLTPSSSVYPSCRYSLWGDSQARIAVSFNGIARILLLASGTQFDSVKREIEVRNIFEYSWGNVEELLLCWSSVRRRLLTHGGHISGFIPKTNFLTPNRFFFLVALGIIFLVVSGKGQAKRELCGNHCIMEVMGRINPKNSFSKSIAMWPPFGGLLFDHDKPESPAQSSVVPKEREE